MNCFGKLAGLALLALAATAQTPGVLTVAEPVKLTVKRTENPVYDLKVSIRPGYHANSNTPTEAYLIPFKLTWESGALESAEVIYPKPKLEKYDFADKPISVFDGEFSIVTKFKRAANPALGPGYLTGKLRYQACNDKMCLPPKTVEVKLPILMQ
ncbi:protein-disulfide reductase DsbD domain-containing protein [uncultured Paludibaculum sp.]|uniref:protein-disulfide reductase DsbD domain-containing protein n=1 Tax=uncultured Paludibaculum sp. TaxID=1765020 RepID=UPI002AAB96C7|nr:protein-disulfide reductase DsbD domain-containing protein [uncultured Paludibaculum sp.]